MSRFFPPRKNGPEAKLFRTFRVRSSRRHSNYTVDHLPYNASLSNTENRQRNATEKDNQVTTSRWSERPTGLRFFSGDWSACSATCGSKGLQYRKVACAHLSKSYIKIVHDKICLKKGFVKPKKTRKCNQNVDCPVWWTGPWSKVSTFERE